jgi:beta-glucosidase
MAKWRVERYLPSVPVDELAKLLPHATIAFDPGLYPAEAAALAKRSELAIVFVTKHEVEGFDSPDLGLPQGQDAIVAAVAAANPHTIVVLETGNPIAMPWKDRVQAIVAAFYPGQAGGQAIAEILAGAVNPSGRLPISFPASLADTPRPELPGYGTVEGTPTAIDYAEGADVGYRWFARTGRKPMFAFGHGLSYTRFSYAKLQATGGRTATVTFTVRNDGDLEGADVPQIYVTSLAGTRTQRLIGFERVSLKPGESKRITLAADPRLLASYDVAAQQWRIAGGRYELALARAADDPVLVTSIELGARTFGK